MIMTNDELKLLNTMLCKYMEELNMRNKVNEIALLNRDFDNYTIGVKAQFEHARCIQRKIAKRINDKIVAR